MGVGHLKLRKLLKEETTYKDKTILKHKCSFTEHCILKIIDKDNNVNYYNVLKCNQCLSFKSIPLPGNISGHIFQDLSLEQKKLPLIVGHCKHYYNVKFMDLENVSFHQSEKT